MTGEVKPAHALGIGVGFLLAAVASASAVHPAALQVGYAGQSSMFRCLFLLLCEQQAQYYPNHGRHLFWRCKLMVDECCAVKSTLSNPPSVFEWYVAFSVEFPSATNTF